MELYALIMIASVLVGFGDSLFSFLFNGSADDDSDDGGQPPKIAACMMTAMAQMMAR